MAGGNPQKRVISQFSAEIRGSYGNCNLGSRAEKGRQGRQKGAPKIGQGAAPFYSSIGETLTESYGNFENVTNF